MQAGQKLLKAEPSNDDLKYVIHWVEPLREQARALLRTEKKSTSEVMKLIKSL